jgi:rhamnulokinase
VSTLVAVDLGAQSGRVAVGSFDGERLEISEAHRFPNVPVRTRDTLSWDILRLYRDTLDGLRAAGRELDRIDAIAVDSWAVDFGLLDRKGRLLQNPVHYRDRRRARAMDGVLALVPARELYERTGIQLIPINTLFQLGGMAAEHDPALETAETLLLIPDLIHYWLCGAQTSELTNATTTQCFDPRAGAWASDVLERAGIPPGLMPEVVQPGTRIGQLDSEVAEETSIGEAQVIAAATHDTGSAVAAVPFARVGSAFISAGTWSLVGLEVDEPIITESTFAANLTNEGGVAGTTRLLRNVTGLWLVHECMGAWAAEGRDYSFEELVALAEQAPPLRSLVDPDDPLFVEQGDMPARVREFCAATGQEEPLEPGTLVRCIFESLALGHARAIRALAAATGEVSEEVHIVGGGARNSLLCQWTADATELPVLAGPYEATVFGNLLVQAIALREIASIAEAREVVRRSFAPLCFEPQESAAWGEARARFEALPIRPPAKVSA